MLNNGRGCNSMKEKISIIIPVYNLEQYITKCLDSVIKQTYTNLEILIIDNNSSDKTLEICQQYALKDSRIKVLNQPIRGASNARNLGLENATGDYIGFVDGDDYIDRNMYRLMIDKLTEFDTDFVICNAYIITPKETKIRIHFNHEKVGKVLTGNDIFEYIFSNSGVLWNTLIKRKNIENLKFETNIGYGEDQLFLFESLKRIQTAIILDKPLYYYLSSREGSVVFSKANEHSLGFLDVTDKVTDFLLKNNLSAAAISRATTSAFEILQKFTVDDDNPYFEEHLNKIKFLFKKITLSDSIVFFKDNSYTFKKKILYTIIKISPKLLLFLYTIHRSIKK